MRTTHSYLARFSHWLFAISILVMGASGLEIFRAFPSFSDKLPNPYEIPVPSFPRLGGWLAGALDWHLTFAWFYAAATILYLFDLARGGWRRLWLSSEELRRITPMARYYLRLGPKPELKALYNPLQKAAYLSMAVTLVLALVTGAMLTLPVQLSSVVWVFGGWQAVRFFHFACLCAFAAFLPGHILMVALAGRTAQSMLTGQTAEVSSSDAKARAATS